MGRVHFEGFSGELFDFLNRLSENNSEGWLEARGAEYESVVLSPIRALVAEAGSILSALNPELQTEPRVGRTISRVRNEPNSRKGLPPYSPFVYACFPRRGHRRSGEHLLAIGVYRHGVTVGFYPGLFKRRRTGQFQEALRENPRLFKKYLDDRRITDKYWELTSGEEGPVMKWPLPKAVRRWAKLESFTVGEYFPSAEPILSSRAFLSRAHEIMLDLYPLWLFAVSDDPERDYELYLESAGAASACLAGAAD